MKTRVTILIILITICSCGSKPDPGEALDKARRLADEGRFQEALKEHVWFHEQALKIDRSYYGVRLSFALSDWVELGQKYPKALEKLKEIRDSKTRRLLAGERDRALFHDVESINDYLNESLATVDLFKRLETAWPEFAKSIYDLVDEALISRGEYALARKHLGDPRSRFDVAKREFEEGIQYSKSVRDSKASLMAFESIFVNDIVRLLTVLDKTGDKTVARAIQSDALKVLNNSAIRVAINNEITEQSHSADADKPRR